MLEALARAAFDPELAALPEGVDTPVGERGLTLSVLRPAGLVEIDGRRVDVVTDGEWVEPGVAVVVTEVEGNRVVVEPEDAASSAGGPDSEVSA